ncbi:tetratricopeptide repeat protein [Chitinimonas sp. PSY-7]|uniref:tetratricopeptide repeat protein n=1 Tax=Chitinimonas sp. PSY-7 TaxID=3459088 RepID=UPI00403FD093
MNTKFDPPVSRLKNGLLCVLVASTLVACGSARPPSSSDSLLKQANEAMNAGAQDRAAELLIQATKQNPTNEVVWVKLAQVQFERQDYPKAIDAATEALARSPNSTEARSIIFVSSMRLAVTSLSEIRADTPLSDSNKSEAETLVKELRDTLGESILIPGVKSINRPAARPRPRPIATKPQADTPATPAAPAAVAPAVTAKPQPAPSTPSADPFGALR